MEGSGQVTRKVGRAVQVRFAWGSVVKDQRYVHAEFGRAGESNAPNLAEPQPKNFVPSAKKRKFPPLDEELQNQRERVQPDKERDREEEDIRRIRHSGGLQTW